MRAHRRRRPLASACLHTLAHHFQLVQKLPATSLVDLVRGGSYPSSALGTWHNFENQRGASGFVGVDAVDIAGMRLAIPAKQFDGNYAIASMGSAALARQVDGTNANVAMKRAAPARNVYGNCAIVGMRRATVAIKNDGHCH